MKGKTFGLSIQKTDAWIISETSGFCLRRHRGQKETEGMRLEREARDLAAAWQSSRQLGQPLGEGGLEWQQR